MTALFFWCESLALESRRVLYDWTLSAPTLRYQERTTSGIVTEPVIRDTQGCRNVLFT